MSGRVKRALLDALYPSGCVCPLCMAETRLGSDGLCGSCRAALRYCAAPVYAEPLDGLTAAFLYADPARSAVLRLKYGKATYLADFFAAHISIPDHWKIDCMIPVPLHWFRAFRRGYNQSEMIAQALSERDIGLPVRADLLRRIRATPSQTNLDAAARRKNVRGAFAADPSVKSLSVLLIDDVVTTHATLTACAAQLKKAGAVRVYAACACAAGEPRA